MPKMITDRDRIRAVLERGVEIIYPTREGLEELLASGKRIKLYCGFDPSAPSLHIGNAICLNKLSQFQELGHEVIFLIGDFTGMIGDPTDKSATRKKLTREEVLKNAEFYVKQASGYLKFDGENPAQVLYNSEWSDKTSFKDLIEITSNFTVQQMLQRDMFQKRVEEGKPIHLHEFLYPIAQAWDAVCMDVDLEIGGNDQMFNMMCGRDLMKAMKGREKFVLTLKLLADDQGKKMGKSEGNAVFLNQEPEDMFGKVMSWPDGVIAAGMELATKMSGEEVEIIRQELASEKVNPRDHKMRLAYEVVRINHGEAAADRAKQYFIDLFQKKDVPEDMEERKLEIRNWIVADLLVEVGLASSKSDARRLVEQGGIRIGKDADSIFPITDANIGISVDAGMIIQRGKRQFVRIIS